MNNKVIILISLLFLSGCFTRAFTTNIEVPDGPPEYQAGWHDGCSTSFSASAFSNARFSKMTMGNGMYQHDQVYQTAWSHGWYACTIQTGNFVGHPMFVAPLQDER
jgi:major membrane immunogen (membrane-anchored lipoprotein)